MKTLLCFCAVTAALAAAFPVNLGAEVTPPGQMKPNVGLADITAKFIRNMKVIKELTPEKEIVDKMDVVIGQADSILKLYSDNGAGRKREELLREKKELEDKGNLRGKDLEKVDKLSKEISELDTTDNFGKSTQYLNAAISELRSLLDQVYTKDEDRIELLRITRMHLEVYQYAYRELSRK